MLLHGVPRPVDSSYRFVSKVRPASTSLVTAVPANATVFQICPSVGFRLQVIAGMAIRIRRYMSSIVQAAASLYIAGGQFGYAVTPFALANNFIAYPMMEAQSINGAAGTAFGVPAGPGQIFALIDEWYEFDDAFTTGAIPPTVQIWSNWVAVNPTAGIINATVAEQLEYDVYISPFSQGVA